MTDIKKKIEIVRDKLNRMILTKDSIANDNELLDLSVTLDKLICLYQYDKSIK